MVTSGLVDRTSVSPYRLTIHLGLAFLLFGLMFWIALGLLASDRKAPAVSTAVSPAVSMGLRSLLRLVLGAGCVTSLAGACGAGTRAGLIYNTGPLMDGRNEIGRAKVGGAEGRAWA